VAPPEKKQAPQQIYFLIPTPNQLPITMITTSFFELFKIGPGPSSSHTIGPMRAAYQFRQDAANYLYTAPHITTSILQIRCELFGALAATGHGHGTHRAVLAGLMGCTPTSVDTEQLTNFFETVNEQYTLDFEQTQILFTENDIFFDYGFNPYRHPNTLKLVLLVNYTPVLTQVFYSVGGGFIEQEGGTKEAIGKTNVAHKPKHVYKNMQELEATQRNTGLPIDQLLIENEMSLTGMTEEQIFDRLDDILRVMDESVQRGLQREGILPGGLNVHRRAKTMYQKAQQLETQRRHADSLFARLNAYALATSEENAAGNMVVTAPTNGAAGVIPACLTYLRTDCQIPEDLLRRGLVVAAMIGFIIKNNASISGAELGCQAEVGSAAAMAAALFAFCHHEALSVMAMAAEIAMEHHLGMTCDPIKGLVQVPCIERNANGAIKAYNAYLLAVGRNTQPIISFDQVVEVMRQTGIDLSEKYKETATGGLASSFGWGNMPGS
jgi:L-serine dehydratase